MKCPLAGGYYKASDTESLFGVHDCLKEKCAWWNKDENWCAILCIAKELFYISGKLFEIKNKLPSPEFFKK